MTLEPVALSLADVAHLCGGRLDATDGSALLSAPPVADSRDVTPGCLFVAVPGARVDGHAFAAQALRAGAVGVLAARPVGGPAVLVPDTVLGLGRLAGGYLDRLHHVSDAGHPLVIAITGSSGKTSTKDLLAQVLAHRGPTVAPAGSFNTEVGLPLTVLRADETTHYLVLEASARAVGHIAYLAGIARPRIGVVLNVGTAHLGEFGSRDIVAQAKGELVEALPSEGVAVLNLDDPLVAAMAERTAAHVVTTGRHAAADVRAVDEATDDAARSTFWLQYADERARVGLRLHGRHHVANALAVAAVALASGFALEEVAQALSSAEPVSRWRMEVRVAARGFTVINDAYNANPESMVAALGALRGFAARRRIAVLGPMAELGEHTETEHRTLGAAVAASGVDFLVTVGEDARAIAEGALAAGLPAASVVSAADVEQAAALVSGYVTEGDVVVVKASRSAQLQRVADLLLAQATVA